MSNPVPNPGFELDTDWTLEGTAFYDTTRPRSGLRNLTAIANQTAIPVGGTATVDFTVEKSRTHECSFWWNLESTERQTPTDLVGYVDPGNGTFVEFARISQAGALGDTWIKAISKFFAVGTACRFRIDAEVETEAPWTSGNTYWYVDDVAVAEADLSVTTDIKTALYQDLVAITVANGYDTEVAEVRKDPTDPTELDTPALVILGLGEGSDEPATLGDRTGEAEQRFRVRGYVRGTESTDPLEALIDDVRNAVGIKASNLKAVASSRVRYAMLESWEEDESSVETRGDLHVFNGVVLVKYLYTRGSL